MKKWNMNWDMQQQKLHHESVQPEESEMRAECNMEHWNMNTVPHEKSAENSSTWKEYNMQKH